MSIAEKLLAIAKNEPKVFNAGKQAEQDRFWDSYQNNGNRTAYNFAFAGSCWKDETYNPKYPINATANANGIFVNVGITDTKVPINLGTTTSNKANMFQYATGLVTIRELIWDSDLSFASQFTGCTRLKNITPNGTFTRDINMQWCPLTLESALSVVNHLYNYTGEDGQDTYTITLNSSVWALLDAWVQEQNFGELYSSAQEWIQSEICWLTA